MPNDTKRLPLLTNSAIATFRRCPREYHYAYEMLRHSVTRSPALTFGLMMHAGLAQWWSPTVDEDPETRMGRVLDAMAIVQGVDALMLVKGECLMRGYTVRWPDEEGIVNVDFRMPFTDTFNMGGSIDCITAAPSYHGPVRVVEHKTTSSDISAGSMYWRSRITLDPQVSAYLIGAKDAGYNASEVLYDVIRKPEIEPLEATPEESRKYTIPTAKNPTPRLYANQREEDETLEVYRVRLMSDIAKRPHWYYARSTIVRLESELEDHMYDVIVTADLIGNTHDRPKHPGACERFHRLCDYFPVCSGETNINDDTRYETKSRAHEELGEDV